MTDGEGYLQADNAYSFDRTNRNFHAQQIFSSFADRAYRERENRSLIYTLLHKPVKGVLSAFPPAPLETSNVFPLLTDMAI